MSKTIPFAGVDRRTAWLRGTLLLATLLGLLASYPVWLNARSYPLAPVSSWFPILPAPFDQILFASMLLSLVAAAWMYRVGVSGFLLLTFLAWCGDLNRGQPWLYMYWVMLLLTLFPKPTAWAGCRWALATVYLWAGVQKCNALYFQKIGWFVEPASTRWHWPASVVEILRWSAASAPFIENAIAVGLWFQTSRRSALGAIIVMHLFALVFLGPLGHNYNWVVWPWNLAMISLALVLFPLGNKALGDADFNLCEAWRALGKSRLAMAIVLAFALLPVLSYKGLWPSAFSFALYSESNASANIFISQTVVDRLPEPLRPYVVSFPNYDPQIQGPFLFNFGLWGYEEMHVPPSAETHAFLTVFTALKPYATEDQDLRMVVGERGGRVMFYQGSTSWELEAQ